MSQRCFTRRMLWDLWDTSTCMAYYHGNTILTQCPVLMKCETSPAGRCSWDSELATVIDACGQMQAFWRLSPLRWKMRWVFFLEVFTHRVRTKLHQLLGAPKRADCTKMSMRLRQRPSARCASSRHGLGRGLRSSSSIWMLMTTTLDSC